MNKLSIIIPAYNAKDTILKTLESIAIQILNYDFEVVIVNDCSNYNYDEFISRFNKFFNIREITLNENVGPGLARKAGILNTDGEYITFIDADDYFYSPYSLYLMLQNIIIAKSDILISNFIYERYKKREVKRKNQVWLHGKIYKRSFLDKYNINFNDTNSNEDNGFNSLIFLLEPKVSYLDEITYVYQENPKSITRINNGIYKFNSLEYFAYNINWAISKAFEKKCKHENVKILSLKFLLAMYLYYLKYFNEYDVNKILKWSKDIYQKFYLNYEYSKSEIDKYMAIQINECLTNDINKHITYDEFLKKVADISD